jgi:hypothetical protein
VKTEQRYGSNELSPEAIRAFPVVLTRGECKECTSGPVGAGEKKVFPFPLAVAASTTSEH